MLKLKAAIGIGGGFCTGKDTLAAQFVELGVWQRLAFADFLKADIFDLLNFGDAAYPLAWKVEWVNQNKTALRSLLQVYGETRRDMDGEDYWVNRLLGYCITKGIDYVVIPDMRYPNELRGIREMAEQSYAVKLTAPEWVIDDRYKVIYGKYPTREQRMHHSETSLNDIHLGPGGLDLVVDTHMWSRDNVFRQVEEDMKRGGFIA